MEDEGLQMADFGLTQGDHDIKLIILLMQISLMLVCKQM